MGRFNEQGVYKESEGWFSWLSGPHDESHTLSPSKMGAFGIDTSDEALERHFNAVDRDGSGKISEKEMKAALVGAYGKGRTLSDALLREMMDTADTNRDGEVDLGEFKIIMRSGPDKIKKALDAGSEAAAQKREKEEREKRQSAADRAAEARAKAQAKEHAAAQRDSAAADRLRAEKAKREEEAIENAKSRAKGDEPTSANPRTPALSGSNVTLGSLLWPLTDSPRVEPVCGQSGGSRRRRGACRRRRRLGRAPCRRRRSRHSSRSGARRRRHPSRRRRCASASGETDRLPTVIGARGMYVAARRGRYARGVRPAVRGGLFCVESPRVSR